MRNTKNHSSKILAWILAVSFLTFGIILSSDNIYKLFFKSVYSVEKENVQLTNQPANVDSKSESLYKELPEKGEQIGSLFIPKLDEKLAVIHGTDEDELSKGVGHYSGSVLPGEQDNSVLSGHRDTVFRRLGEVGVGDDLVVTTSAGTFTYKVRKVRIVDADDRTVIVPKPNATLTLTTCYPFTFIGSAPERYVLVADLIQKDSE